MASTEQAPQSTATLQELAKRHLWMHFTRMSAYQDADIPIIVRGEGCYVYDEHGKRYLDGLSALFCVNIGHGRADIAQAGADQAKDLGFYTNWSYAHPRSIELAARVAELAPGDLNRVFFTSGGSEAVESAIKLSRQYHKLTGHPTKTKFIAREIAYHGTSLGALAATGITSLREPFEPLTPGGCHVPNTNTFRMPQVTAHDLAETVAQRIEFEGPETVAAVIMEPVQNAGGCFTPPDGYWQRVREICDEYNVLLISDEVICAWGRLGEWFGAQRYDYHPDIITTAKGLTSSYAPMGAAIVSDRIAEPFMEGHNSFMHGITFAGHPMSSAIALANLDAMEHEGILENVRANEGAFRGMLESLRDIPIVGDVRGAGYFHAIELVKDQDSNEQWSDEESETLLRGFLSGELYERGLICRADDRGDPVIQLSPPLIAGPQQFEEIEGILRPVLTEAHQRMHAHPPARGAAGMKVGVPSEIKTDEYRVALTPAGTRELVDAGHEVFVQKGAGEGSSIIDDAYVAQGATILPDADAVFAETQMIVKVKEPQPIEVARLEPRHTLFTYLHLAADAELTKGLKESGATCIAYETVEDAKGRLPLLAPMSEVAGKIATQAGAFMLEKPLGGRGILLGGVPGVAAANVMVIGGGVVGMNAAFIALGMEATVFVYDRNIDRLRELDIAFNGRADTCFATTLSIEERLPDVDLVIGAVLVHGAKAPHVITRDQLPLMKRQAVLVDVSIDQGGCFETSRPTTHSDPTYEVDGITHYCVANMPGAVPITSTYALTNATMPYVVQLASSGVHKAVRESPGLKLGVNVAAGEVTYAPVAEAVGFDSVDVDEALAAVPA